MTESLNQEILMALNAVSSRLSSSEQWMDSAEEQLQGRFSGQAPMTSSVKGTSALALYQYNTDAEDDADIPSAKLLKGSNQIQDAVNQRLEELNSLNEKGMSKF